MHSSKVFLFLLGTACGPATPSGTPAEGDGLAGSSGSAGLANTVGGSGTGTGGAGGSGGGSAGTSGGTSVGGNSAAGAGGKASGGTSSAGAGNASGTLTGESGVWEDVTPAGLSMDPDFNPADNFGAMDVLADPAHAGTFFAFVCYQGVWKSVDFGSTWTKVETDNDLEQGRPWGEAIAPDGSYMLASTGYGTARWGAWKSIDDGVTWEKYEIVDNSDPYMFDIDPGDKDHVLSTSHSVGNIYESTDGGETWSDRGDGGVGHSGYVFFVTSSTWLLIAQNGAGSTRRSTNSGSSWSDVGPMSHVHGGQQIYIDPENQHIYVPAHGYPSGIYRSTDGGASFAQVSPAQSAAIFATATRIYSLDSGASLQGTPPTPYSATRASGTDWTSMTVPPAMTNGAKRADVTYDAVSDRHVIVSGNWNAGIWRYIEE